MSDAYLTHDSFVDQWSSASLRRKRRFKPKRSLVEASVDELLLLLKYVLATVSLISMLDFFVVSK